jgi:hypothetical protein
MMEIESARTKTGDARMVTAGPLKMTKARHGAQNQNELLKVAEDISP